MDHSQHTQSDREQHISRALTGLALGGLLVGAAVIAAPHVLPMLGFGSAEAAGQASMALRNPSGISASVNGFLAAVPLIGEKLAEGGLFNAAATGIIGIGGTLLGQFIANREDGSKAIKWGNVIRYGALITSAIIALPTVLSAISSGLIFLATMGGSQEALLNTVSTVRSTIGSSGMIHSMTAGSGLAAALPHFITCGTSIVPAALTVHHLKKDRAAKREGFAQQLSHERMHESPGIGFAY